MPINQFIDEYFTATRGTPFSAFQQQMQCQLDEQFFSKVHGRKPAWDDTIAELPRHTTTQFEFGRGSVRIGEAGEIPAIEAQLKQFRPWRKGPFNFFGTEINTEWRSDWKWSRIQPHLANLQGRRVLDIGCGNGYHLFRMLGDGAEMALGIDPTRLFLYQFHIARHFLPPTAAFLLPLRSEDLPAFNCFDTVFSLGVLYHRRSPIDHLLELQSFLRPGGELVLETLIVAGDEDTVLVPQGRYAKMPNVWFLPSANLLEIWLKRIGLTNVRTVDVNQTSTEEQRVTDWMTFQSLNDFLDPNNKNLTLEGLPAPTRAIVIAEKA